MSFGKLGAMGRGMGHLGALGGVSSGPAPSLSSTTFTDGDFIGKTIATVTPTSAVLTDDANGRFSLSGGMLRLEKLGTAGATYNPKINGVTVNMQCVAYTLPASLKMRLNAVDSTKTWQDSAGVATPAVANGDPVGSVTDQISGWRFNQTTSGARPTLDTVTFNHPCFNFDGVDDFWTAVTSSAISYLNAGFNNKKFTIVAVFQATAATIGNQELLAWGTATINHLIYRSNTTSSLAPGAVIGNGGATTTFIPMDQVPTGNPHIVSFTCDGADANTLMLFYRDGVYTPSSGAPNSGQNLTATQLGAFSPVPTTLNIGRRTTTASGFLKGKLLDLLIFDDTIGNFEMQQVHKLLSTYWGGTISTYVNTNFVDLTKFEDTPWWIEEFNSNPINPSPTNDNNPTGWIPFYIAAQTPATRWGTIGATANEQAFYPDTRNTDLTPAFTDPVSFANSVMSMQAAHIPPALGSARTQGVGTITATTGSTAVTGSGTAFTTALAAGNRLYSDSGSFIGTVASIADDTHLTLRSNGINAITAGTFRWSNPMVATQYAMAGTITCSTGSKTVTGVGTTFNDASSASLVPRGNYQTGMMLHDNSGNVIGTIASISNATTITLVENAQVNVSGGAFKLSHVGQDMPFLGTAWISLGYKQQVYGRIRFRAQLPTAQSGAWSTGWMEASAGRTPPEIDVWEQFSATSGVQLFVPGIHADPYFYSNTVSGNGPNPGGLSGGTSAGLFTGVATDTMDKEFHNIEVDWLPDGITFTVDSKILGSVDPISGIRSVPTISAAGSGLANGTYNIFGDGGRTSSNDGTAQGTVVVSGGVATSVTLAKSGQGYDRGSGWLEWSANLAAADTITLNGVVFTAVASGAVGTQFNIGASLSATLANVVVAVTAWSPVMSQITLRSTGTRLQIQSRTRLNAAFTIAASSASATSGATLAYGPTWYTDSSKNVPLTTTLPGVVLASDYGPDTALPAQFHNAMYLLIANQIGGLSGTLNPAIRMPNYKLDKIEWTKYKPATPATLVRGVNPAFDASVDSIVAAYKAALITKGGSVSAARETAIRNWVQAMMSWQVRYDTVPPTNLTSDWDIAKLSLFDARDLIYPCFFAFDMPKACMKLNIKNPATGELAEVGAGITQDSAKGSLVLPGTAAVYMNSSVAVGSTQFGNVDNGFEILLMGTPTNVSSGNLMGFNTAGRWDASATDWDAFMHTTTAPSGAITKSKPMVAGHYTVSRGWRPNVECFQNGEWFGGGLLSGQPIDALTGNFKIGSYDGATQGAAFPFALASVGRRLTQLESQKLNAIHRAAMIEIGLTPP